MKGQVFKLKWDDQKIRRIVAWRVQTWVVVYVSQAAGSCTHSEWVVNRISVTDMTDTVTISGTSLKTKSHSMTFPFVFQTHELGFPPGAVTRASDRQTWWLLSDSFHVREQRPNRCPSSFYLASIKFFRWDMVMCITGNNILRLFWVKKCFLKSY